jgi:fatty acid desaturase
MKTLQDLTTPSISQFLFRGALNWLEIVLILIVVVKVDHWAVMIAGGLLLGTRQHALALLAHEALHKNVSNRLWLNNLLGNLLAALPLYQSLNFFKRFHLEHHSHLLTDGDPEVHVRRASEQIWATPLSKKKRFFILLRDLSSWGYLDTRHALPYIWPHITWIDLILPILWWSGVVVLLRQFELGWLAWFWMGAFVTSYWAMFRQRALTEHIGTTDTHKIQANLVQRFFYLPHNTWYHFEHHQKANVPCWNLPAYRRLLQTTPVMSVGEMFSRLESDVKETI